MMYIIPIWLLVMIKPEYRTLEMNLIFILIMLLSLVIRNTGVKISVIYTLLMIMTMVSAMIYSFITGNTEPLLYAFLFGIPITFSKH